MVPFLLLAVGLFLIYVEFYVPGGIMGTVGGVTLIVSILLFAKENESVPLVFAFMLGVAVALFATVKLALWRVSSGSGVYLEGDQEGYRSEKFEEGLIGQEGKALSDLRPSGFVKIDGKRRQAVSRMGYIEKGTPVEVIGGEGAHLIVKKKD